jgi:hypothetical protein
LAFYRPKSKELSAFPKPYPLPNRAFGDGMKFGMNRIGLATEGKNKNAGKRKA